MIKRILIAVLGFALIALTLSAVKVAQIKGAGGPPPPVMTVSWMEARTETWNPTIAGIGTIAPIQGVSLSTEVEGTVTKIGFENGQLVKEGDLLIELDATVEQAQLKASGAQLELAKLGFGRSTELLQKNTISQAEVDQATAQLNQADANMAALKAMIDKKVVRAPFTGRVGIRSVNLGQFVSRGQPLVGVQKLDQLYVNFNLSERDLPKLEVGEKLRVKVDAFPDREFEGKLAAISPEINSSTRNIAVQGIIDNADEALRPGMFARITLELPQVQSLVVVPATAVHRAAYGDSVFIVEKMKNPQGEEYLGVRQQFVKLGDTRGDLVSIVEGVKVGEKVVSAGVFKLRNAAPVQENNSAQPSSSTSPSPANT